MSDFKDIVVNTYPHIIHGTFNRIIYYETDSILNNLIRLHVASMPNADEKMLITDKFFIFKGIWQGILETLYEKYLSHVKYDFKWDLEVTPYTLMLCELTKKNFDSIEVELLKKIINYSDEQIESDFKDLADKYTNNDTLGKYIVLKSLEMLKNTHCVFRDNTRQILIRYCIIRIEYDCCVK